MARNNTNRKYKNKRKKKKIASGNKAPQVVFLLILQESPSVGVLPRAMVAGFIDGVCFVIVWLKHLLFV